MVEQDLDGLHLLWLDLARRERVVEHHPQRIPPVEALPALLSAPVQQQLHDVRAVPVGRPVQGVRVSRAVSVEDVDLRAVVEQEADHLDVAVVEAREVQGRHALEPVALQRIDIDLAGVRCPYLVDGALPRCVEEGRVGGAVWRCPCRLHRYAGQTRRLS